MGGLHSGQCLQSVSFPIIIDNFDEVFKQVWKLKIPSKVSHFIWRLIQERLPTKVNMRRRNVELNDILCPFCRLNEEEVSHLFFNCDRILPLWWESLTWLNIKAVFPKSPRDHFLQHCHRYLKGIISQ